MWCGSLFLLLASLLLFFYFVDLMHQENIQRFIEFYRFQIKDGMVAVDATTAYKIIHYCAIEIWIYNYQMT